MLKAKNNDPLIQNALIGRMAIIVTLILTLTNILIAQQVLMLSKFLGRHCNLKYCFLKINEIP